MCQQGYTAETREEVYLTIENVHVVYNGKKNPVELSIKNWCYVSRIHGVRIRSVWGFDVKLLEMRTPFWMTEIKRGHVWYEDIRSEMALYMESAPPLWPIMLKNLQCDLFFFFNCTKYNPAGRQLKGMKSVMKTETFQQFQRSFMPANSIKNNGDANYTEQMMEGWSCLKTQTKLQLQ